MLAIYPVNNVYVRIECDEDVAAELSDYFAFDKPGAVFMRRQARFKHWDGKIRLFKLASRRIYRGLVPRVLEFANTHGYEVVNHVPPPRSAPCSFALTQSLAALHLPFPPRDYQLAALHYALTANRGIILSPTASGKSLIIYLLEEILNVKTLIIVPTLGLIAQMVNDFRTYGYRDPITTIQGGTAKTTDTRVTISTWQSIHTLPAPYYAQFACIVVDEVHTAKAARLMGIMEKCDAPYRLGFTGTMDDTEIHRLQLEGLFGSVRRVASTSELIKAKQLSPLRVKMCVLDYPQAIRKQLRRGTYEEEVDWIVREPARNAFIAQLVMATQGNTLVLFQFVEKHGLALFAHIAELAKKHGKVVHYIAGSVNAEDRERIRQTVATGDNHIIVASYQTMQLGINCPNLKNLVPAHPAKSSIRVLQSIGRILRLAEGKEGAMLIDIADDLRIGKYVNHLWKHAQDRVTYYSTEKFVMSMQTVAVETFAVDRARTAPAALGGPTDASDEGNYWPMH